MCFNERTGSILYLAASLEDADRTFSQNPKIQETLKQYRSEISDESSREVLDLLLFNGVGKLPSVSPRAKMKLDRLRESVKAERKRARVRD